MASNYPFVLIFDDDQSKEWTEEILRRSGNAPLWVFCSTMKEPGDRIVKGEMDVSSFFFETVARNWERVEVMVYSPVRHAEIESEEIAQDWNFLHRPAPLLRIFSAWANRKPSLLVCCPNLARPVPVKKSLFSASNPLLHTFHSNFNLVDHYILNFKNLRTLNIHHHSNLSQLLRALSMATSLETLELYTPTDYNVGALRDSPFPVVLPLLSDLTIFSRIHTFLALMDRITTAPGCCIHADVHASADREIADSILEQIINMIPKILTKCITHPKVTKLSGDPVFDMRRDSHLRLVSCTRGSGPNFSLAFHLPVLTEEQRKHAVPRLLQSFHSRHFQDNVSELWIEILPMNPICEQVSDAIEAFLSTLPITHLHIDHMYSLEACFGSDLFPRLHSLTVDLHNFDSPISSEDNDESESALQGLSEFLQRRRSIGRPISLVCIDGPYLMSSDTKWIRLCTHLDNLEGLKLVCEDQSFDKKLEYLCGSGDPSTIELLNN